MAAPDAVSVTLWLIQIEGVAGATVMTGSGFTVIETVAMLLQLFAAVPATE